MIEYASEVLLRQHRQFLFTVLINRRTTFLVRWDRGGAVVARPFDYTEEPKKLLNFVYRLATATTKSHQGYDPTVVLASKGEKLFTSYAATLKDGSDAREYADAVLEDLSHHLLCKVCCPRALRTLRLLMHCLYR